LHEYYLFFSFQLGHMVANACSMYCASKSGLNAIANTAAVEAAPLGVRVNIVSPGLVITEMSQKGFGMPDKRYKHSVVFY